MSIPASCEFHHVDTGNLRAFVNLRYGDFMIKGFKVLEKKGGGLWVAPPSKPCKNTTSGYTDMVYLPDRDRREAFERFVLDEYARDVKRQTAPST